MIRIRDIAAKLELSRVTVSAILNNRYKKLGISEKTAERVRACADELGYVPDQNALSMKEGRSLTIGMISSALSEGWGARIMVGALQALKGTPYRLRIEAVRGAPLALRDAGRHGARAGQQPVVRVVAWRPCDGVQACLRLRAPQASQFDVVRPRANKILTMHRVNEIEVRD